MQIIHEFSLKQLRIFDEKFYKNKTWLFQIIENYYEYFSIYNQLLQRYIDVI